MDRVEVFDGQTLEGACRILGHTERGLKGEEIGRLLEEIEVADVSPEVTKWKRIYNAGPRLGLLMHWFSVNLHLKIQDRLDRSRALLSLSIDNEQK